MSSPNLTAQRLRACREQHRETLDQVARVLGVNKSTVMRWERGATVNISRATLELLARHYAVSADWLAGRENAPAAHDAPAPLVQLPSLGAVRAGYGGAVFQEVVGYEPATASSIQPGEEYCWLRVTGDSMTPLLNEGDLVLVRKQPAVDSGDYAVAIINEEEGTVKQVRNLADGIELLSVNPYYPPRRFEGEAAAQVRILGRVMESKRKF